MNNGRGEAITEPSGKGAYAEAMRELIAELTPLPTRMRATVHSDQSRTGSATRHLRLVRD